MLSTIAVGTDGSATAAAALEVAVGMAKRFDSELVLISAFSDSRRGSRAAGGASEEAQWASNPAARTREILSRAEEKLRGDGVKCKTLVDEGDPADVIVRLAEECGADVLVIGNKGMNRRVLGSVPKTVTQEAPCSVFVVKTT
jgi:nucleotide-binding universal stress UspA family protein